MAKAKYNLQRAFRKLVLDFQRCSLIPSMYRYKLLKLAGVKIHGKPFIGQDVIFDSMANCKIISVILVIPLPPFKAAHARTLFFHHSAICLISFRLIFPSCCLLPTGYCSAAKTYHKSIIASSGLSF